MMNMVILSFFIFLVFILLSVGFVTLLERKFLSLINFRIGPFKFYYLGVFHFFGDVFKMIFKEWVDLFVFNMFIYYFFPFSMIIVSFLFWLIFPLFNFVFFVSFTYILFVLLLGLKIFFLLIVGWSVNSIYSMISVIRMVVQVISYEVSFVLVVLIFLVIMVEFDLVWFINYQVYVVFLFFSFFIFFIFFISFVCEVGRLPFDFYEGESELVSGFNIEYNSLFFMYMYMVEYLDILYLSYVISLFMFCFSILSIFFSFFVLFFFVLVVFVRGVFVRLRYDEMMILMWLYFLPVLINYLFMYVFVYF